MNCKRARLQIALCVGGDLESDDCRELRQHLSSCEHCREQYDQMKSGVATLQERHENEDPYSLSDSLWPDLLQRLPARPGRGIPEFNGWWAALAVCVACVALLSFWNRETRVDRQVYADGSDSAAAPSAREIKEPIPGPVVMPVDDEIANNPVLRTDLDSRTYGFSTSSHPARVIYTSFGIAGPWSGDRHSLTGE